MKHTALLLSLSLLVLPGCWKDKKDKEAPSAQPVIPQEPAADEPHINHVEQPGDTNFDIERTADLESEMKEACHDCDGK